MKITWALIIACTFYVGCKRGMEEYGTEEPIHLKEWTVIGPFLSEKEQLVEDLTGINIDYLRAFGTAENKCEPERLPSELYGKFLMELPGLNIHRLFPGLDSQNSTVYFLTSIDIRRPQDIVLLYEGIQESKVYLNGEVVYRSGWKDSDRKQYEEFVILHLKKGINQVLIKVSCCPSSAKWSFNAFLSSIAVAKEKYGIDYLFDFLEESILTGDTIKAYTGPYCGDSVSMILTDGETRIETVPTGHYRETGYSEFAVPPSVRSKLCTATMKAGNMAFEQLIFIGDAEQYATELISAHKDSNGDLSTSANKERVRHLFSKMIFNHRKSIKRYWDRNKLFYIRELKNQLANEDGIIRAFRSDIDGSTQHYLLKTSGLVENTAADLVIFFPMNYNLTLPYLQRWILSNLDQIQWDIKIANDAGFTYVYPELRGRTAGSPMEMADFLGMLNDISQSLDIGNIYIVGNCSSCFQALKHSYTFSQNISGIALISPTSSPDHLMEIGEISDIPLLVYTSDDDEVVRRKDVDLFVEKISLVNSKITYMVKEGATHYKAPKNINTYPVGFFSALASTKKYSPPYYPVSVGPQREIQDFFSREFVFGVHPLCPELSLAFDSLWNGLFYDHYYRRELKSTFMESKNLIIPVNKYNAAEIANYTGVEILIDDETISVANKAFTGKNLVLYQTVQDIGSTREILLICHNYPDNSTPRLKVPFEIQSERYLSRDSEAE